MELPELPFALTASPPEVWRRDTRVGAITVAAPAHTDLYVNPGGENAADAESMMNAATLLGTPPAGDFQFSARVTVDFQAQYDAGVLLLWSDERNWAEAASSTRPRQKPWSSLWSRARSPTMPMPSSWTERLYGFGSHGSTTCSPTTRRPTATRGEWSASSALVATSPRLRSDSKDNHPPEMAARSPSTRSGSAANASLTFATARESPGAGRLSHPHEVALAPAPARSTRLICRRRKSACSYSVERAPGAGQGGPSRTKRRIWTACRRPFGNSSRASQRQAATIARMSRRHS